jgi:hypothetical protein
MDLRLGDAADLALHVGKVEATDRIARGCAQARVVEAFGSLEVAAGYL